MNESSPIYIFLANFELFSTMLLERVGRERWDKLLLYHFFFKMFAQFHH